MATILVVDDEPDIRELVRVNLELDGHQVLQAANGAEALDVVKERAPDVMLLDIMMPEVDGWQVLEAIKGARDEGIKEIPILLLTAYDSPDNRVRGAIEGAIRYLGKPFSPIDLRREVREALQGAPEPEKRRQVQRAALEQLARMEKGEAPEASIGARPRITRFERRPASAAEPRHVIAAREKLAELTEKQRQLLEELAGAPSVSDAAQDLGVSRSNVYASLRRISRKLGIASVPELLELVRDGALVRPRR